MEEILYYIAYLNDRTLVISGLRQRLTQWEREQENDPELLRIVEEIKNVYNNVDSKRIDQGGFLTITGRELRQYLTSPIYLEDDKGENAFEIKEDKEYYIYITEGVALDTIEIVQFKLSFR